MCLGRWRDIFLYAYDASGRMEELAEDFGERRRERMDEFRARRKTTEEEAKKRWEERRAEWRGRMQEQVRDAVKEAGLPTKDELDELKKMVADLTKKVDQLSKK